MTDKSCGKNDINELYFTLQSLFQVCFQMQLSFEEKSVVTRVLLQKLCAHLVHDERKERKKKEICDCVTSTNFFHQRFIRLLNKITGQFLFGNILL